MKKIFTLLVAVLLTSSVFAQSPEKMSYQAVIRNSKDQLVTNQQVGIQISILQGSASGTEVYSETQTPNTNTNGLVSIEIGGGAGFSSIDWSTGPYFIKTETDPTGGTNYTITGTSMLLSVPYALHAKTVETITETDPKISSINTNYLFKWNGSQLVQSTIFDNGQIGINLSSTPGQLLHIGDGNLLIEGGGETAFIMKRNITYAGGPSGVSANPIFSFGRIVKAGDGDPEFRFMYSDDLTAERSVFEFDRKGIIASVKPDVGSHFEGFITGDDEPLFRLNSYPGMRLEMGAGGDTPVDVAVGRLGSAKLGLSTNGIDRMVIDSNGNIGIGISFPERALHINDVLRLQPRAVAPSDPKPGDMYIDSSDSNKLKVYDGTTWQSCW